MVLGIVGRRFEIVNGFWMSILILEDEGFEFRVEECRFYFLSSIDLLKVLVVE